MPKNGTAWPVRPSRVNEGALDAEPMPRASEQAGDEAVARQAQEATPSGDVTEEAERPEAG